MEKNLSEEQKHQLLKRFENGDYNYVIDLLMNVIENLNEDFVALNLLAYSFQKQHLYDLAEKYYEQSIDANPRYLEALINKSKLFSELQRLDDAINAALNAVNVDPMSIKAKENLILQTAQRDLTEASTIAQNLLTVDADNSIASNIIGLSFLKNKNQSLAIQHYSKFLKPKPEFADHFNNTGTAYADLGARKEAVKYYKEAIKLSPQNPKYLVNLAYALSTKGSFSEALRLFESAIELDKNNRSAHVGRELCDRHSCGLKTSQKFCEKIDAEKYIPYITPFSATILTSNPSFQLEVAKYYASKHDNNSVKAKITRRLNGSIKVGYLSSNFYGHPVGRIAVRVLENHQNKNIKIYCYQVSSVPKDDVYKRFRASAFVFRDLSKFNENLISKTIRNDDIDILVDLSGYTENTKPSVIFDRVAPIQVSYLGQPGSMGTNAIDYIIADENLIPNSHQKYYTENPIYMPNAYYPIPDIDRIPFTLQMRKEIGLPEDKFIFCCINNSYKITNVVLTTWVQILESVPNSVLWFCISDKQIRSNILSKVTELGADTNRIVFTHPVPYGEYLKRLQCADLFLDTFGYNAGSTAGDVIGSGVPLLTLRGESYSSRMASSLLHSIEADHYICESIKEYKNKAVSFAMDRDLRKDFNSLVEKAMFSTKKSCASVFASNLEEAYLYIFNHEIMGKKARPVYPSDYIARSLPDTVDRRGTQ
jgi:protein O-GlcNAc transferase